MKSRPNHPAFASLIPAVITGVLLASLAVAYNPYDDKKDRKPSPAPAPPPARTAPSQPARTPPPQQPARTPPPQAAPPQRTYFPANTNPQVNNAPRNTQQQNQTNTPQMHYPRPAPNANQPPVANPASTPQVRNPQWQGNRLPAPTNQPGVDPRSQRNTMPANGRGVYPTPAPNQGPRTPVQSNPQPGGGYAGSRYSNSQPRPMEQRRFTSPSGHQADFRGGAVHTLTTPSGMRINQVGGTREVYARRGDRVIVTNAGGRHGFVQREVVVRNQRFVQRTYYSNGVRYAHVYRPYAYRGMVVNVYTPVRYYRPAFYTYAVNPWRTPVVYSWGWTNDPWYGAYGRAYFTPYSVYPGPALWLTDYLIASSFREAYQANMDASGAGAAPMNAYGPPMGDDVKQLVSQEVQWQLNREKAQAQQQGQTGGPPPGSDPPVLADGGTRTLLAFSRLNADSGGQECTVTEGDILRFDSSQPIGGPNASVQVMWSKGDDCPTGSTITLPIEQVQELQNHMMENMGQGLQEMQNQQGQNGLPKLNPALMGSTQAPFAAELPPPEPNVENVLKEQAQEGETAVTQVTEEAQRAWTPAPPQAQAEQFQPQTQTAQGAGPRPVNIVKKMTVQDVTSQLGNPASIISDGKNKQIYVYTNPNLKITFDKGKVHKVE